MCDGSGNNTNLVNQAAVSYILNFSGLRTLKSVTPTLTLAF